MISENIRGKTGRRIAFEKINELWDEEIRAEMNSDDAEVQMKRRSKNAQRHL
jgi:hypothetical protein